MKKFLGFKGNYEYIAYIICSKAFKCKSFGKLGLKRVLSGLLLIFSFFTLLTIILTIITYNSYKMVGVFAVLAVGIMLMYVPLQCLAISLNNVIIYKVNINSYSSSLDNLEHRFLEKNQIVIGKEERRKVLKGLFSQNQKFFEQTEAESGSIQRLNGLIPEVRDKLDSLGYVTEGVVFQRIE